ncbi:MAG: hypothetical protein ACOH2H_16230 [Cypionkella sp.]
MKMAQNTKDFNPSRRNMIAMGPAAALVACLSGPAIAESAVGLAHSPIITLMHEWERLSAGWKDSTMTDAEGYALCADMHAVEQEMFDIPSQSGRDFAAKLIVRTWHGDLEMDADGMAILIAEAEKLVEGAI